MNQHKVISDEQLFAGEDLFQIRILSEKDLEALRQERLTKESWW